jgi:L-glyceraldehyde 3-phosphate reductase
MVKRLNALNDMAKERGQSLSQMAVAWLLHNPAVATVLCGASRPEQIVNNVGALKNLEFTGEEISRIEELLK